MALKNLVVVMLVVMAHTTLAHGSPQDYVAAHNTVRARAGVGPLTWNSTVAGYAQNYANSRIENCELEHSNGPYGENIALGYGTFSGVDAVKLWASEQPNYDYAANTCVQNVDDGQCLHYTQIVWKDTTQLGCGSAKCKNGWVFITCNYAPFGNIIGQRPY